MYSVQNEGTMWGRQVPLDTLPILGGLPETLTISLDRLVCEKYVCNSVIEAIENIIYSIETKDAELQKNYKNHLEPYIIFRNIDV